jgi:hypothetical protein
MRLTTFKIFSLGKLVIFKFFTTLTRYSAASAELFWRR